MAAESFFGIVMDSKDGEPLTGYGEGTSGSYRGKWITGDYDLMDIFGVGGDCDQPKDSAAFGAIRTELNKEMGWDGIQHGPQSLFVSRKLNINMPKDYPAYLASDLKEPPKKDLGEDRPPMAVCDNKLTAVGPDEYVVYFESHEDVKTALVCCGCARVAPKKWQEEEEKLKKMPKESE